jgi:hypothetical protein
MRIIVVLVISVAVLSFAGWIAYTVMTTKVHSPEETVAFSLGDDTFTVTYCRPFKKGRKIFGGLVPHGEYWRTGANDATEVSFSKAIIFGGEQVPAGRYRLYTTPDVNQWQVVLNGELSQWGAFMPNHDLDIADVQVPTRVMPNLVEQFTIYFDEAGQDTGYNMHMQWDQTEVIIPITIQ